MSEASGPDIDEDRVVAFHYRLTNGFGELIDGSQGGLPLVYMHNTNALLPGLERELTGRRAGEALQVTLFPEDAYGYADEALIEDWPLESVQALMGAGTQLQPGLRIAARGKDVDGEQQRMLSVVEVDDDRVRLDGNHPLAGQVLHFEITIVAVRESTDAERAAGQATSVNP